MKKIFKAFWLIITVLALNACKKDKDELAPVTPPEKNKTVFFSDNIGSSYALNALTGVSLWKYTANNNPNNYNYYNSPAVTKEASVFFDYERGVLYCIDNYTGALKWSKDNQPMSWLESPLIINDVVYVGTGGKITGYNLTDGSLVNEINVPNNYWPNSLNYSKGMFIVGICGGHLIGIKMDGTVQGEYESNNGRYHSNPAFN